MGLRFISSFVEEIKQNVRANLQTNIEAIERGLQVLPMILREVLPDLFVLFVDSLIFGFSKALAEQGLRDDINVNWINPGMIKTQRLEHSFHTRSIQQKKSINQLKSETMTLKGIRRLGEPEDVASLVLFLCKKEARHIQGCGINIDGGENKSYF